MKECICCKKKKPLSEFNLNKTKKDGLQNFCRKCNSDKLKKHYNNNKDAYLKKNAARIHVLYDYVLSLKVKCSECGESHPSCLDFHHLDRNKKDITVCLAIHRGWSKIRIKKEIDKCIVLCSNCHRKLHYKEKAL